MKNKVKSDAAKAAIRKGIITTTVVVVVAAIIGIGVWAIGHFSKSDEEDRVVLAKKYEGPDKDYVLENDNLVLTVSSDTSQFSVYNKNTGKTWYSNPQDREDDNIALPVDRDKLGATLLLTYSTKNGVDTLFDNYTYSMKNQMYDIEQGDDYIKVMYSIGIVEKEFVIPPAITAENMDKLLAVLEKKEAPEQRGPERYEGIGGKIPPRIAKYELFSYLCAPKRSSGRGRAHSSVGQSSGLIIRRSWDHAPLGPPVNPAANKFAAGFLFSTGDRGFSRFFRIFAGKQKKQRLWNSKVPCTK